MQFCKRMSKEWPLPPFSGKTCQNLMCFHAMTHKNTQSATAANTFQFTFCCFTTTLLKQKPQEQSACFWHCRSHSKGSSRREGLLCWFFTRLFLSTCHFNKAKVFKWTLPALTKTKWGQMSLINKIPQLAIFSWQLKVKMFSAEVFERDYQTKNLL